MDKRKYIALISLLITIYYGVFYIHSNSIYGIGDDIFEDDSYFENNPPLVTDFVKKIENLWFVNIESFDSKNEVGAKRLYISSTILKGVSYCMVYYKENHLIGSFSCKVAEPFWFLK
jgi:hypothetical protein